MILRKLPGPFLAWIGTLVFLLLMQFLIRYQKDLVGKGLPLEAIAELIVYNLAYIIVLAVPMSVLTAVIIVFGKLADTNVYNAARGAGISLLQLAWPVLLLALCVGAGMVYFNNVVLPEANFRARNLWQDIKRKQPGFALQPGIFYTGLNSYTILVQATDGPNHLREVTVFDYTEGTERRRVMRAARGEIVPLPGDRVDLILEDGTLDRMVPLGGAQDVYRYERSFFGRLRFALDLSAFQFERSEDRDGYRTDRTMRTSEMVAVVDSIEAGIAREHARLHRLNAGLLGAVEDTVEYFGREGFTITPADTLARPAHAPTANNLLAGLDSTGQVAVLERAREQARMRRNAAESVQQTLHYEAQRADRYRVEIHKKFSVAAACVVFALIGIPVGLLVRRGGMATSGALALVIFLFYWVTLVQGEKWADRGHLDPVVGMWTANVIIGVVGALLLFNIVPVARVRAWSQHLLRWRKPPGDADAPV